MCLRCRVRFKNQPAAPDEAAMRGMVNSRQSAAANPRAEEIRGPVGNGWSHNSSRSGQAGVIRMGWRLDDPFGPAAIATWGYFEAARPGFLRFPAQTLP